MKSIHLYFRQSVITSVILLSAIFYYGCSVNLIATYDQTAVNDIIQAYQLVDSFYQKLSNTPEDQRDYKTFSGDYEKIESSLRVLVLRNSARTLNKESTEIAKNILGLWQKYKNNHKESNNYDSDLIEIHRNRFFENFEAMTVAENSKPRTKEQ